MIYKYIITIRKHQVKDYVVESDIDAVVSYLKLKHDSLKVLNHAYEIGHKYNQLHFHAMISLCHAIRYSDNSKHNGFFIHWKRIYNECNAVKYILKDSPNRYEQEQILTINKYCHSKAPNGFINSSI